MQPIERGSAVRHENLARACEHYSTSARISSHGGSSNVPPFSCRGFFIMHSPRVPSLNLFLRPIAISLTSVFHRSLCLLWRQRYRPPLYYYHVPKPFRPISLTGRSRLVCYIARWKFKWKFILFAQIWLQLVL